MSSVAGRHVLERGGPRTEVATSRVDVRATGILAAGLTMAVVAWGYLVWLAIDLGAAARSGTDGAWMVMGAALLGAIACLFTGLLLGVRLGRALGLTGSAAPAGRRRSH